jgi:hypothetical protein
MSIGNTKDKGNNYGNNYPYQLANLKLLGGITDLSTTANGTLLSILAALQGGQNFAQNLVEDLGGAGCPSNCPVYIEIKIWNGTTFDPPVYYDALGNAYNPPGGPAPTLVGPITYINPDFHLAQMVALLTSIDNSVDVNLSTRNAEATQLLIKNLLTAQTTRVHNTVSATGSGTVPASIRGSVINVGNAAGTWNGISLPAGVSIPWDSVGNRDTYSAISYNATGTTFIIEYTT